MKTKLDYINIIDLEATCWDGDAPKGESQEIIEIGITQFSVVHKAAVKSSGILVEPRHSTVSDFCTKLTTITQEQLEEKGYHFEDAIDHLVQEYKIGARAWASWGEWDKKMFDRNFKLYNMHNIMQNLPHFNVKMLFSMKMGTTKLFGMDKALEMAGLQLDGTHHRGIDDTKNIAKLLNFVLS